MKKLINKLKWTIMAGFIFYGIFSLTSSLFPMMTKLLMDKYNLGAPYLGKLFIWFLILVVLNNCFEYLNRLWEWKLSRDFNLEIRQQLFSKFISQKPKKFEQAQPVDYLSIINNNVDAVYEDYLSAWIDLLKSIANLLIYCGSMLFVLDLRLMGIIIIFSVGTSLLPIFTQKKLAKLRKEQLGQLKLYNRLLLDLLSGYKYVQQKTIKIFRKRHQDSLTQSEEKNFRFGQFRVLSDMTNSIGTNLMNLAVFSLAGYLLLHDEISLGAVSAAFLYTGQLIGSMQGVLSCINVLNSSKDIVAEIEEQLELPELEESDYPPRQVAVFEINNLSFQRNEYKMFIDAVTFEKFHPTAIIGQSGVGKSTLVKLLNGELTPSTGSFYFDEVPINTSDRTASIFTLQQREHLFEASFTENVTLFGSYPLNPQVNQLLNELPESIQNRVINYHDISELSGGERQIICILRMLNFDFPITFLDEPFTGVDQKSKQIILDFLVKYQQGIYIEVTHDTQSVTLKKYDQVYQVFDGALHLYSQFDK